jgi:uncharacterized protein DUF4845
MTKRQRGISLMNLIIWLAVLGFLAVMGAKLLPAYIEYANVKKVLASMEQAGSLKGTVREIRYDWEKRNAIEDIKSIRGEDLEITKAGGETVVTAAWSVKIPLVGNASACLDFVVTTAK